MDMDSPKFEPLLNEPKGSNRYTIFPIQYMDLWDMYKKAQSAYWTTEEIDLSKDMQFWEDLSDNERHFIKNVLAFFAASDGIVNENIVSRFSNEVKSAEARAFYAFQAAIETVHSETYSLLIDTYIKDTEEKDRLLNAIDNIPCVERKANWAKRWIESQDCFSVRLIAFACVEGIFFSGAFCAIYWLKEKGVMPGLGFSNELISRDEGMHTDFAILLYKHLENKCSMQDVHEIVKECVEIEKEFILESIPCSMLGMNNELMSQYIEFVADRLLLQLGYAILYETRNPFDFMDRISLTNKTNFFEERVSEYSRAHVSESGGNQFQFGTDEEF